MEQLQINVCFETLLFPSSPICSNFQFSIDSSSGFAFSVHGPAWLSGKVFDS